MVDIDEISQEYIENAHNVIGTNVKKIRESKNISQLELSHKIGHKSVSIISCAEISHKKHHFNIEHLLRIAFVLEVDVCVFFENIEEIEEENH